MIVALENLGLIRRTPYQARSIRVLVPLVIVPFALALLPETARRELEEI